MILFSRPTATITPERQVYVPGEIVRALVQIRGTGSLALQGVRVELRRIRRFAYEQRVRGKNGYRWVKHWSTDTRIVGAIPLLSGGNLEEGMVIEQVVTFQLPPDAAPTSQGSLLGTTWDVHLVLDRHLTFDVNATAAIALLAPASHAAGRISTAWQGNAPEQCSVAFQLPDRVIQTGNTLAGTLIVRAREAVKLRGLRLELVRTEMTPGNPAFQKTRGCTASTSVLTLPVGPSGTIPANSPVQVPFALPLPPNLSPTTFTSNGTIRWLLRGIVDRSFATDYRGEVEVCIYNGPESPTATSAAPVAPPPVRPLPPADASEFPPLAPSPLRLTLTYQEPAELRGQAITATGAHLTLGRHHECDVDIPELTVSRTHATIWREGEAFYIHDVQSTGGTWVNGIAVHERHPLRSGDTLQLGQKVSFAVALEAVDTI